MNADQSDFALVIVLTGVLVLFILLVMALFFGVLVLLDWRDAWRRRRAQAKMLREDLMKTRSYGLEPVAYEGGIGSDIHPTPLSPPSPQPDLPS